MAGGKKGHATVEGMAFVTQQLVGLFPRESKAVMRRSTLQIASSIRNDMRKAAPKDKGTLRKAIKSKRSKGRPGMVGAEVIITKGREEEYDAFYWHMVDRGTKHSRAKPFTQAAIESHRANYKDTLREAINKQVVKQLEIRAKRQKINRR